MHRSISKLVLMINFATLVTDKNVQNLLVTHLSCDEQWSLGKLVEDVGITASLEEIRDHLSVVTLRRVVNQSFTEVVHEVDIVLGTF